MGRREGAEDGPGELNGKLMGFALSVVYAAARAHIRYRPPGIRCPGNVYRLYLQPTIRAISVPPTDPPPLPHSPHSPHLPPPPFRPAFGLATMCVPRVHTSYLPLHSDKG